MNTIHGGRRRTQGLPLRVELFVRGLPLARYLYISYGRILMPAGLQCSLLFSFVLVLVSATSVFGQPALLRGLVVHGPDNRPIGNVLLTVTRVDDAMPVRIRRTATPADDFGYFQFELLPPGRYTITITLPPFQPHVESITLLADDMKTLMIRLVLRDEEHLEVVNTPTATTTLLMPDGSIGATFSRQEIEQLPATHGRTVQSMLALVPGIIFTDSVGTLAQFTAGGQRRFANRMTIDGVNADLALNPMDGTGPAASGGLPAFATSGGTQTLVSQDGIQEITVKTSSATSEFAQAPGAQTVIVTRSGGDRFAATGSANLRPASWAAGNWFSNAGRALPSDNQLWAAAASTGGPLLSRRLFYFGTWEHQRIARPITTTIEVPSQAVRDQASATVRDVLDAFPQPNGPDTSDGYAQFRARFPVNSRLNAVSVRLDARLPPTHQAFLRLNYGHSNGDALSSGLGIFIPEPFLPIRRTEAATIGTATAGWTATPSSTLVHDLRISGSWHTGSALDAPTSYGGSRPLPVGELVSSPVDQTWLGLSLTGPRRALATGPRRGNTARLFQIVDTLSLVRGRHQWRLGFDYAHTLTSTSPAAYQYTYQFDTVNDLLQGRVLFAGLIRAVPAAVARNAVALFVQDTWRLTPRLTLDLGLRYGIQPAPANRTATAPMLLRAEALPKVEVLPARSPLWQTVWSNLAPRVSATFQLRTTPDRETLLSSAWSAIYDDAIPPGGSPFSQGYPFMSARVLGPSHARADAAAPNPFDRDDFSTYFAIPRSFRTPKTSQWHLGLEQALPGRQRLAMIYTGAFGRDLSYSSLDVIRPGGPFIRAYSNDGRAAYHAALVEYVLRPSAGLQARVTYTWSRAHDNQSGEQLPTASPPPALVPPNLNYGVADFDRPHLLQVSASYQLSRVRRSGLLATLANDWRVDLVGHLRSGVPFSVDALRNLGRGVWLVRPDIVPGVPLWLPDASSPGGRRLNSAAFYNTQEPRQGTLGRNALRTTPLRQVDLALSRTLHLGDRATAQVRLECSNVFNVPTFARPYAQLGSSFFGQPFASSADALGAGTLTAGGLSPLLQLGGPRAAQVSIRFGF